MVEYFIHLKRKNYCKQEQSLVEFEKKKVMKKYF